jgi:16S rRNA (cytidine1402-2'-O)-methyltransferase
MQEINSFIMLSIVSTPIGNLEDITLRALRILKEADYIACEDTRVTWQLLVHYDIANGGRLMSFHSHSGFSKVEKIIELLTEWKHVALVSDAGTPGISDPGYVLIKKAIEAGITVVPVPWASAVLSALVASGFDCHQYLYLGFLPVKKGRQTMLKSLVNKEYTVVFYESVHRIEKTLDEFESYFGTDTQIVIGREITKKFEEFKRGTIAEVRNYFKWEGKVKGEFVVVF